VARAYRYLSWAKRNRRSSFAWPSIFAAAVAKNHILRVRQLKSPALIFKLNQT